MSNLRFSAIPPIFPYFRCVFDYFTGSRRITPQDGVNRTFESLSSFPRYSSTSESPERWLASNEAHIEQLLKTNPEVALALIGEVPFKRCLVLICRQNPHCMKELSQRAATWRAQGSLSNLFNAKNIWAQLSPFVSDLNALEPILLLDVDVMCAQLFLIIEDTVSYRTFTALRDGDAQQMLDLLQTLLDIPLDPLFRPSLIRAICHLSKVSGLRPKFLVQEGVTFDGKHALKWGKLGDVWRGKLQGVPVAIRVVKLYHTTQSDEYLKMFLKEALIWRQLDHPNVLPFLCLYMRHDREVCLVSPWMVNGNLEGYLRTVPGADRMSLVLDVAEGLAYLHSMTPPVIHADLRAANVFVTKEGTACLADFGFSRLQSLTTALTKHDSSSNLRWLSPEILDGTQLLHDTRSDMYAFACVCYEVFSGQAPFHDGVQESAVLVKIVRGVRPPRPTVCEPSKQDCISLGLDDKMWNIILGCWKASPGDRPTAEDIVKLLTSKVLRRQTQGGLFPLPQRNTSTLLRFLAQD